MASRSLAGAPGFTLLAIVSLALGIMATTAMYSVVRAVVLDPFPYKDVDNLMSIRVADPGGRGGRTYYSTDQYLEFAGRATIFEGVVASTISDVIWTGSGDPQRLRGNHITTNTFDVMGVPPLLGRTVRPADGVPGALPVVVLGFKFWQRQFGGEPSVVGRQMLLNGVNRTVVGVMPKRFMWRGADVYVPVVFEQGKVIEGVRNVHVLGRLKAGVTEAQAEADLRPIVADLAQREPAQFPDGRWRVGLLSFKETFPSGLRETLWILFAAVGLLLLIACVNVSNLLLSRAATRQREMAVRAAIGAGRARLARQLLTESLLIAVGGAVVGVPLAYVGLTAIIALVPPNTIPDESEIVINGAVLAFTVGGLDGHGAHLRSRAGVAGLVHRSHRIAEGRCQVGDRWQAPGDCEQRPGHRRGRAVRDAAGGRRAHDAHARGDAGPRSRHPAGAPDDDAGAAGGDALSGQRTPRGLFPGAARPARDGAGRAGCRRQLRRPPVCGLADPD